MSSVSDQFRKITGLDDPIPEAPAKKRSKAKAKVEEPVVEETTTEE